MQSFEDVQSKAVRDAIAIWEAGVRAVDGKQAVVNCALDPLSEPDTDGDLSFFEHNIDRNSFDRIFVIGAGKASASMANGLHVVLQQYGLLERVADSWINVPDNMADDSCFFYLHPARPVGINLPREQVVYGTNKIVQIVEEMTARDLCICLISGGGSALLASPIPPVTLEEKRKLTEQLSALGADITQINAVRKCISQVKGGKLAQRCRKGQLVSLVISDIMGDPLEFIASGPTVATTSTQSDALAVLNTFDPDRTLISPSVYKVLYSKQPSLPSNTHVTNIVVANNPIAVDAAGVEAVARGYDYIMTCDLKRDTDAKAVGRQLADWIKKSIEGGGPNCLVSGGEPIVRLCENPGQGGRNQQAIIEALYYLCRSEIAELLKHDFVILSGGTDGEDGTSDAAGAWLNRQVLAKASSNIEAVEHHRTYNDAYHLFKQLGNLFSTGPTGTNVCDIRVALINRK